MELYLFKLPTSDNLGQSYLPALGDFEEGALRIAGGFTRVGVQAGGWRRPVPTPSPVSIRTQVVFDDIAAYEVACEAFAATRLVDLAFKLFPDQSALFVAVLGEAENITREAWGDDEAGSQVFGRRTEFDQPSVTLADVSSGWSGDPAPVILGESESPQERADLMADAVVLYGRADADLAPSVIRAPRQPRDFSQASGGFVPPDYVALPPQGDDAGPYSIEERAQKTAELLEGFAQPMQDAAWGIQSSLAYVRRVKADGADRSVIAHAYRLFDAALEKARRVLAQTDS